MAYQSDEVLTGSERRRSYTPAEKARLVNEAFRPGVVVKDAARRLGVYESLLYRWRQALQLAPGPADLPATGTAGRRGAPSTGSWRCPGCGPGHGAQRSR
ncbi:transposase [Skermanella sp. TT6]|uniref:Transposase n=1 Tax=Skermanella cutis TaxID=2775420 RepID=A0ABX7BCS8_9PROT|nr:transposase [Skermanella sp. TT6]